MALQTDGWYLRADVIWAKPNPMPESVTDRPTKAHEYLFLLSRSPRYFYDADAVREPSTTTRAELLEFGDARPDTGYPGHSQNRRRYKMPDGWDTGAGGHGSASTSASSPSTERRMGGFNGRWDADEANGTAPAGRNLRSVWSIATEPYPGAHFATFPQKLVEPCILAGTSGRGVCPECGAPWVRETMHVVGQSHDGPKTSAAALARGGRGATSTVGQSGGGRIDGWTQTTGWRPPCRHDAVPVPATCLDPFGGSGTVALVAERLGRRSILVELNPDYCAQAMERVAAGRRDGTGAAVDMPLPAPQGSLWDVA